MRIKVSLITTFVCSTLFSQTGEYKFEHLTISHGLSHNSVTNILQDHKGFMWIGTSDGLNLYDGYSFRTFRANAVDSGSISSNKITKLFEDSRSGLWIGTRNGLNYFDWGSFSFKKIGFEGLKPDDPDVFVKAIYEDSDSVIWVGTYGNGLFLFDRKSGLFTNIPLQYDGYEDYLELDLLVSAIFEDSRGNFWIGTNRTGLIKLRREDYSAEFIDLDPVNQLPENSYVKTIFEDREGYLWICSEMEGLFQFLPSEGVTGHFKNIPESNSLGNNIVKDIFQDEQGYLWLATDGGGISIFDKNTGNFRYLNYSISDETSLSSNAIYSFYKDERNILWIGTFGGGVNILDPNKKPFYHFTQEESSRNSLSHPSVLSFAEDKSGLIWIGTDGGGLNRFDPEKREFAVYVNAPGNKKSLSSNAVTAVFEDSYQNLWVGTFSGGLNLFDRDKKEFYAFRADKNDPKSIINDNVWVIYETRARQMLIGTLGGLDLLDRKTMRFIHLQMPVGNRSSYFTRILSVTEDSQGYIWIGSESLWRLNLRDTSFVEIPLILAHDTLKWEYDVREVFEDSGGILWVGTEGGGLLRYDTGNQIFKSYTESNGLSNNAVHEILEDVNGFLWLSTNKGLTRFDPESEEFRNFDYSDGLQSNQFSYSASLKASDGIMYFGGVNGFNLFDPLEIKENKFIPPVIFTDFRLFNRPVEISAPGSPLRSHISETKSLVLKFSQSVLSFEFAALNYTASLKNQYEFIMEGFENEWNKVGNQRTATYTNLDPGDYVFRVRGSNNDGVWNDLGTSLNITILPPYWETKVAFLVYSLIILLLLYSFRRYAIARSQMKNELKLKDLEKQKIEEVNQMKMQFFTNISHEFRTPLTLIISPLEKLMETGQKDPGISQLYKLMHRNASRLLSLINQLMDLRKIEKGSMDLKLTRQDIVSFVKDIKTAFNELAVERSIGFNFSSNIPNMDLWFDADKIDKIVYNLLSNAFKFSPEKGKISVTVKLKTREVIHDSVSRKFIKKVQGLPESLIGGYIEISVRDNGNGIATDLQDKVFERFFQVPDNLKLRSSGTGVGLSLARDLAGLHKGKLELISTPGKGSKFSLLLPIDHSCYEKEQFSDIPLSVSSHPEIDTDVDGDFPSLKETESVSDIPEEERNIPGILIVEDNSDVRNFIRMNLHTQYRIYEAGNGAEGIEIARQAVPDVILSDIMMPEMDGLEMAQILQADPICSHIPILFLTAKTAEQTKIRSLETGVIDYISKPFNPRILTLKIRNIIENRQKQAEQIRKRMILEPANIEIESVDEKFLRRAMEIVEARISDTEFDVQEFVDEMGISRSVLYRKLRAVTNQSANEFINLIRLKRAAQLLAQKNMNVSEISYMVGFNDPQYFSKCFRKQYGKTPSQFSANLNS